MINKLPKTRDNELLVQNLGKEILIYDLLTHKAYSLNETLSIVYNACDGKTSFDDLKRKNRFTDDLIYLSLDELQMNNLLEGYQSNYFAGLSRREVIRKVGLATMISLPVIIGITAPTAAHAASGMNSCRNNSDCNGNMRVCVEGICYARGTFPSGTTLSICRGQGCENNYDSISNCRFSSRNSCYSKSATYECTYPPGMPVACYCKCV